MCDVNGPFKLCTCKGKIDKSQPYWVLKYKIKDDQSIHSVLGMFSSADAVLEPIFKKNIVSRLNKNNVFDFEYTPSEDDLLVLVDSRGEYYLMFNNGKWKWIKNYEYIGQSYAKYNHRKSGKIDGEKSRLTIAIENYESRTGKKLQFYHEDYPSRIINGFNEFDRKISSEELIKYLENKTV